MEGERERRAVTSRNKQRHRPGAAGYTTIYPILSYPTLSRRLIVDWLPLVGVGFGSCPRPAFGVNVRVAV